MSGDASTKGKQIKTNSGSSDFFLKAEESTRLKGQGRERGDEGEETRLYFQRKTKFQT